MNPSFLKSEDLKMAKAKMTIDKALIEWYSKKRYMGCVAGARLVQQIYQ